jgi:hypothetical protein
MKGTILIRNRTPRVAMFAVLAAAAWPAVSDAIMYFRQILPVAPGPNAEALKSLDAYFTWRRRPEAEAFVN